MKNAHEPKMTSDRQVAEKKAVLNDGNKIPVIGLGTFLSAPNEVTDAVVAG